MPQLKLNKASLSLEQRNLRNYEKYLPSLELKRKKLLTERARVEGVLNQLKEQEHVLRHRAEEHFPMVNAESLCLKSLISIDKIDLLEENIVGVRLPVFQTIQWQILEYSYFNTPHWFESWLSLVKQTLELRVAQNIALQRHQLLDKAIQTVTQRKNLFEKVLIPNALKHIRLIQIFLADNERAAVVRSKIAKKKRQLL